MPARKVTHLPKQDNYCDCGLFTLTYIHFFTFQAPESVEIERMESMGGQLLGATLSFASLSRPFPVTEAGMHTLDFNTPSLSGLGPEEGMLWSSCSQAVANPKPCLQMTRAISP